MYGPGALTSGDGAIGPIGRIPGTGGGIGPGIGGGIGPGTGGGTWHAANATNNERTKIFIFLNFFGLKFESNLIWK